MTTSAPGPEDAALHHEARYRVRFDEAGPAGLLRTSGLMRYAQDVAWRHSSALGFDRDWYRELRLTWLVRAAELEVTAPIPLGMEVLSRTAIVGQRRVWARRRGEFRLPDGSQAGWVHTDWVMIDGRGALSRIPAVISERFRIPEATGQIGRVSLPPTPSSATIRTFTVRPHELDPLDHVNNAVYLDWFEEAVAAAGGDRAELGTIPRRYRLEYAAAADGGTIVADAAWRHEGGWAYRARIPGGADVFRASMFPGGA